MAIRKPIIYYILYPIVKLMYMNTKVIYEEEINEPSVFISNHAKANGPVMINMYLKRDIVNWAIHCALDEKYAVNYAYHDVLCGDASKHKKFTLFIAKWIAKRLPRILKTYKNIIPVYHNMKIKYTLDRSMEALENGSDLVIFAESNNDYSKYIANLQTGFVILGKMYYKSTGKLLNFYPTYLSKKRKRIMVGKPIKYDPNISLNENRKIINKYLIENITRLANSLKPHKPVTFLSEKWYRTYGEYKDDIYGYWKMIENDIRK